MPMAMSEYPEKSQYICMENNKAPVIKAMALKPLGSPNAWSTKGATASAMTTFLKNPQSACRMPSTAF